MNLRIKFYYPFLIVNSILYLVFIVLIILFVTLPTSESNGCGGRASIEVNSTAKEVVKVCLLSIIGGPTALTNGLVCLGGVLCVFDGCCLDHVAGVDR